MYNTVEAARSNPYFKRNHVGKVTCTLCNIYCNDENNFLRHLSGKTHALQLERMQRHELRQRRLEEEDRLNAQEAEAAEREKAARDLANAALSHLPGNSSSNGNNSNTTAALAVLQTGRYGLPLYNFRTEHDLTRGLSTKVWLEFYFTKAEDGTRPLHRWLSAREQHVEQPADDYFIYLVVACEGYTTAALKFPAKAVRLQDMITAQKANSSYYNSSNNNSYDPTAAGGGSKSDNNNKESTYYVAWNALRKVYSMYFVLTRTA